MTPTYRSRSRTSLHEMKPLDRDNGFCSDFPFTSASQPYHSTTALSDSMFEPLESISPLSYPSQLRNYMNSPERGEYTSSPPPQISFPGSSPSLHRPTPLGQQLQKQAERNSMQGSRNSIQGSRGSISALGSRTSFSGSRNSFLSSNNAMSRDEMRTSGYLLQGSKTMSDDGGSQISLRPLMKQRSLDVVPTRESPQSQKIDLMCIPNPLALQREEDREDGDGEDENDLCTDPLGPIMTSTPTNQGADDLPTKEERQPKVKQNSSKSDELGALVSPRKKSLQQLTSLGREEEEASTVAAPDSLEVTGGSEEGSSPKEEKPRPKPMSRLEKLTSLDYIRSSIRRSLKKNREKRVKFRSTPDSTPKAKKKNPPHNLSVDLTPDSLTFTNQEAIDSEEHDISPRIQTPSPISPEFEAVDDYPQRRPYNPDIYPETPSLRHPFPGGGRGASGGGATRMRAYSDMPMFAPQLSQPTYYPSTMHYQPNYPQLSQQYFPPSYAPHYMVSPAHRSHGPPQPVHTPLESYSRRYTDTAVGSGGGTSHMGGARGGGVPSQNHKQSSADNHRANLMRSPDMYAEMGIILSQQDHILSQDHSSNASRVQSPDVYPGMAPGYIEGPLRHRSIPTSPEEGPFSPQHYPTRGAGAPHSVKTSPYREQSIENQMGYRPSNHLQSPTHYREGMTDISTDGRYRRNSIEHQMKRSSMEIPPILPHHIRQGSAEKQLPIADHIRRTSISNQVPPNTGNYRRSSIDGQAPSTNHPGAQYQGYRDFGFRMGPGLPRNGDDWQHSQRDDHYGMGSQQYDRMESLEWDDEATPTDANHGERQIDSGTTRTKVKWNAEVIEHERTPSDISDTYDL